MCLLLTPPCLFLWLLTSWFLSLSHLHDLTPTAPCSDRETVSTHIHIDVCTLQHHTQRLQCEPLLSSADNKREGWPLAASFCLTLSLCNPSSHLPLLIYTCFSLHSSLPLLLPCSALLVDSFVCTLLCWCFFVFFLLTPSLSLPLFFVPCFSISHLLFVSSLVVLKHAIFSPHPSSLFDLLAQHSLLHRSTVLTLL